MPRRIVPLITDEIYHVFNRGIDRRPTFLSKWEYVRAANLLNYYRFRIPPIKYSKFLTCSIDQQEQILKQLKKENDKRVEITTFFYSNKSQTKASADLSLTGRTAIPASTI